MTDYDEFAWCKICNAAMLIQLSEHMQTQIHMCICSLSDVFECLLLRPLADTMQQEVAQET